MLWRGPMGGGAASGKIGAMIAGHCAQGQYLKARVKPTNPASVFQHPPRNALARLTPVWSNQLTSTQRDAWNVYAANTTWLNRLGDTVHLSGQMEFIRSNTVRLQADQLFGDPFDFPLLGIIADAPTIYDRGDPGPTPALSTIPDNDYVTMTYDNTADWVSSDSNNAMLVYVNIPRPSSISFFRRRTRLAGIIHASDATGSFNFLNQWLPAIAYNQKWTAWWAIARADGRLTKAAPVAAFDTGPAPPPFWLELFPYSPGNLVGSGSWTGSTAATVSPGECDINPADTGNATNPATMVPLDLSQPWYFEFDYDLTVSGSGDASLNFELDSGAGDTTTLFIAWTAGDMTLNLISNLSWNDGNGNFHTLLAIPALSSSPHTIRLFFDGANLGVSLDTVTLFSFAATITAASGPVGITISGSTAADTLTLTRLLRIQGA